MVPENFDLRPKGIIQMLDLLRPIYAISPGSHIGIPVTDTHGTP